MSRVAHPCRAGLLLLATVLLVACAASLDRRVEEIVREALPRLVGPADRYDTSVRGASLGGDRIEELRAFGVRVRREGAPVLDQVGLVLSDVSVDREARRVTSIGQAEVNVQVTAPDLADHLRKQDWIEDPVVRFGAPAEVVISGRLKVPGMPFLTAPPGEFRGQLVPQASQLMLRVSALSLGGRQAPAVLRAVVEQAINPVFDSAAYAVPSRLDRVSVEGERLVLQASGSRTSLRR